MKTVYFIKPIGMEGPIKIGCSRSPQMRRDQLEVWSPVPLEILAEIPGNFQLERRFHAKFYGQHSHKEWFHTSPELLADIASINAGTFDLDALPDPRALHKPGCKTGRKWSDELRVRVLRDNALRRIEKAKGLVCPALDAETVALFLADPEKHGITVAERLRRRAARTAEYYQDKANSLLAKAA